jgi:hypothetical protein
VNHRQSVIDLCGVDEFLKNELQTSSKELASLARRILAILGETRHLGMNYRPSTIDHRRGLCIVALVNLTLMRNTLDRRLSCKPNDPSKPRGLRVLSLDGGGARAVVSLQVLKLLEQITGKRVCLHIDLSLSLYLYLSACVCHSVLSRRLTCADPRHANCSI